MTSNFKEQLISFKVYGLLKYAHEQTFYSLKKAASRATPCKVLIPPISANPFDIDELFKKIIQSAKENAITIVSAPAIAVLFPLRKFSKP